MDLQCTEAHDKDERLAYASRMLSEVQAILEKANYDVAAAYIQMAIDQCADTQTLADPARVPQQDT